MNPIGMFGTPAPPASPADDALMMTFEFFDEHGRFNPRNILILSDDPAQRSPFHKLYPIACFMRWHAKVWTVNFAKAHLNSSPHCAEFLRNVKREGIVRRGQFLDLLTDHALSRTNAQGGEAPSSKNIFEPYLENLRSTVIHHLRSMPWDKLDERFFKNFGLSHAKSMAEYIQSLALHEENTVLVEKIWTFVDSYESWTRDNHPAEDSETETICNVMRTAIEGYGFKEFYNEDERQLKSYGVITPISQLVEQRISLRIDFAEKMPGYAGSVLQKLAASSLIDVVNSKEIDHAIKRLAITVFHGRCDVETMKELITLPHTQWKKVLGFLSDSQFKYFISFLASLEKRLNEVESMSTMLREAGEKRTQVNHMLHDFLGKDMAARYAAIAALDWQSEDVLERLTVRDVESIDSWLESLAPSRASKAELQLASIIFSAANRKMAQRNISLGDSLTQKRNILRIRAEVFSSGDSAPVGLTEKDLQEKDEDIWTKIKDKVFAAVDQAENEDKPPRLRSSEFFWFTLTEHAFSDETNLIATMKNSLQHGWWELEPLEVVCKRTPPEWHSLLPSLDENELKFFLQRVSTLGKVLGKVRSQLGPMVSAEDANKAKTSVVFPTFFYLDRASQYRYLQAISWESPEVAGSLTEGDADVICRWIYELRFADLGANEQALVFRIVKAMRAATLTTTDRKQSVKPYLDSIEKEAGYILDLRALFKSDVSVPSAAPDEAAEDKEMGLRRGIQKKFEEAFGKLDADTQPRSHLLRRIERSGLLRYLVADQDSAVDAISSGPNDVLELTLFAKQPTSKRKSRMPKWVSTLGFLNESQKVFVADRLRSLAADLPKIRARSDMNRIAQERRVNEAIALWLAEPDSDAEEGDLSA